MASNTRAEIREFIEGRLRATDLTDDQDIFARGLANSLFAMELVLFIEKHFGMQISNEDLDIANFRTIAAMAVLVDRVRVAA